MGTRIGSVDINGDDNEEEFVEDGLVVLGRGNPEKVAEKEVCKEDELPFVSTSYLLDPTYCGCMAVTLRERVPPAFLKCT